MEVCIIGSGNVATHLSQALISAGHTISAIYSHHIEHAKHLAEKLGVSLYTDNIQELPKSDAYLFMIKDNALSNAVAQLKKNDSAHNALWIHTSGCMPLSTFCHITNAAVMYPLQTISKGRAINFKNVPLFIEGNNEFANMQIEQLSNQLSESVTPLNSEQRKIVHLAAVFANNFTNHCCTLAYKMLEDNGINPELLTPIIAETFSKLNEIGPGNSQTGPAVRWDINVLHAHTDLLKAVPSIQHIYKLMSDSIHYYHSESHCKTANYTKNLTNDKL